MVKIHAVIEASSKPEEQQQQQQQQQQHYSHHNRGYNGHSGANAAHTPVSSVAIWESGGTIKIFSGSHDGKWRLWNAGNNFAKEFEHGMGGGKVECVDVASNFLFCGFEGTSIQVPGVKVGMIHAWNLSVPTEPPLEFHMGNLAPYAHGGGVSSFAYSGERIASGSHDGTIRSWRYDAAANATGVTPGKGGFAMDKTFHGHSGEVNGLVVVGGAMLWSCGNDMTIRLWDMSTAECKYLISQDTPATPGAGSQPLQAAAAAVGQPPSQTSPKGVGHTASVTELLLFESPHGNFVLSSSLDGSVKAWDASNGTCMFSESHGEGVVSMALSADLKGNPLLLVGLESGAIMVRSILQTPNAPAFCLLITLTQMFTSGHDGSVKSIRSGPSNTFYSAGSDGKVIVWQFTGDFGL